MINASKLHLFKNLKIKNVTKKKLHLKKLKNYIDIQNMIQQLLQQGIFYLLRISKSRYFSQSFY